MCVTSLEVSFSRSIYALCCNLFSFVFCFVFLFFYLSFVFFFSLRLLISSEARRKLPLQVYMSSRQHIGGFLESFVQHLHSLLSFLKIFKLVACKRLRGMVFVKEPLSLPVNNTMSRKSMSLNTLVI